MREEAGAGQAGSEEPTGEVLSSTSTLASLVVANV